MFNDYLESLDFLKHKFRQLQRRQILFSIDGKVKSKQGMSQKKRNIVKRDLNQRFINLGRKAFTSNVYLRILYCYNDNSPPTVVNASKNMLDLMHVNRNQQDPRENDGAIRSRLPYYDDSQVSFLSVRQNIEMQSAGAHILIESFNAVLEYANIFKRLKDENRVAGRERERDVDLTEPINYPVNSLGYKIEMYQRQQDILRINEVQPFYLDLLYNHNKYKRRGTSFVDILMTVLKYPIRVSVTIPRNTEEIVSQKEVITKKLSAFKKQYPLFSALYGPIILSVFYKPKNNINLKDVDNFIREVVAPCFEAIFTPPSRMFAPTKEELATIRAVNYCNNLNGHIMGYDILRLPDSREHTKHDAVCIIGFHMESHSDVIGSLKEEIEKILEHA
jgi:hypothetical protein